MKAFLWLLAVALGVLCCGAWLVSELVTSYVRDFRHGFTPPALADPVLHHMWLWFCPLPWIVYAALLSWRREVSAGGVFVFAGTIALAMVAIVCVVAVGAILGCVPFYLSR